MTVSIAKYLRLFVLAIFFATLASCGGGGGGGGSGGGGGGSGGTSLRVSTNSLNFEANLLGPIPDDQTFTVSWTGSNVAGFAIGVPPGETVPSWLVVDALGNQSPVTVRIGVNTTGLAAGTYRVTLRVVTGDINANPLDTANVEVTYTVTDDFAVSESTLVFDAPVDGAPPAPQGFAITGAGVTWSAAADQPWVTLSASNGATPSTVNVTVDQAGFPVGAQTATITVTNDNDPTESANIAVTMNVRQPAVVLNRTSVGFTGTNGRDLGSNGVNFSLDNGQVTPWTITPSESWIVIDSPTSSAPGTVQVSVDASIPPLASGQHNGELEFSTTYMGTPITTILPVDVLLTLPELTVFPQSLSFQGGPPTDFPPQELSVRLGPQVGFETQPWQINASDAWLDVPASGTFNGRTEISIGIDTTNQTEDSYTGALDVTVTVNGDVLTQSVPVALTLEPHRLLVADNGVALVDSPGPGKLTHTVTVSDNRRIETPWTATSNEAWLSVTPSGMTDSELMLTADPAGLAADTIHYASVTVSSSALSVTNTEEIKVGLYIASVAPADPVSLTLPRLVGAAPGIAADPIRPHVYITNKTADIDIYNIYTGALVDTIATEGTDLRTLTVASDGDRLYALDFVEHGIVMVDLTTPSPTPNPLWTDPAWVCPCSGDGERPLFTYTRTNGREVLIGGTTDVIDALDGSRLIGSPANRNSTGHSVSRYHLKYSELDNQAFVDFVLQQSYPNFNRGLSTDPAGDRVFRACWYPTNEIEIYNGEDLSPISVIPSGQFGSALYGPDDLVYCARYYSELSAPGSGDIWSIDPATRVVQAEFNVPGEINQEIYTISGDGQRIIVRSNDNEDLTIFTIP